MAKSKEQRKEIREMYLTVQANKEAVLNADKGIFITDGSFRLNNNSAIVSLKTSTNVFQIRDAYAGLLETIKSKQEANKVLGIVDSEPTHYGASLPEWTSDFKTRIAQLNRAALIKQIEEDESYLLTLDPSILSEIKFEELKKRNAAIAATKAQSLPEEIAAPKV